MTSDASLDRDGQTVTVRVPLKIRRHGGRKMIIAPEGAAPWAPPRARIDNTMVKAIARAFRWRRLLEEGHYGSVVELAEPRRSTSPTSAGSCACRSWLLRSSKPF